MFKLALSIDVPRGEIALCVCETCSMVAGWLCGHSY